LERAVYCRSSRQSILQNSSIPNRFSLVCHRACLFFFRSDYERLVVVNGGYPASLLCRSAIIAWWLAGKRPLAVLNFHNYAHKSALYQRIFENAIDALVVRTAGKIVSVSENCLDSLSNRPAFLGSNKLSFIHNGIEDPLTTWSDRLPITGKEVTNRYCLMLATYEPRKGHSYILRAFKDVAQSYQDVQLKVHGHGLGSEKQKVIDEVALHRLEGNVQIGDFVCNSQELIASASVLVVPSQSYESFGLTIIEAMAYGIPVVTTDVGGMPEVLEGTGAGYICSKDNPQEFADAIKAILGDSHLAAELGNNGRKSFEIKYRAPIMANQYSELLKARTNE
jgi:glycosyltransferase involved in cell wall biosynthesis